jgi:ankyrin repeat protein
MLTENNFHHHNGGSVIPQHRTHYAPYQHQAYQGKSSQQQQSDLQIPKFDLHHAVRTNDVAGIIRLHSRLRQHPTVADNCLLDSNGHTPLYTAISNGRLAMVDLLLQLGHNPVSDLLFYKLCLEFTFSIAYL